MKRRRSFTHMTPLLVLIAVGFGVTNASAASRSVVSAQVPANSCAGLVARRGPDVNRPNVHVSVEASPQRSSVTGETTVEFRPDLPINELVFRLWPNRAVGAKENLLRVTKAIVPGFPKAVGRLENATTFTINLGAVVPSGQTVSSVLQWSLRVPGTTDDRVSRGGDAMRLGSFYPLLAWESGVGWSRTPHTKARGEASMAATSNITLDVKTDPGYTTLATGTEVSQDARTGTSSWSAPVARDIGLSIGKFTLVQRNLANIGDSGAAAAGVAQDTSIPSTVQITVGVANGVRESPQTYMSRVLTAIRELTNRYGPFPYESFSLAITPGLKGGIEYPGHVMQGPNSMGRTTPHEVAHQYFYGLVGNDQGRDPWLDEGLATWAEGRLEGTTAALGAKIVPGDAIGKYRSPMSYWDFHTSSYYRGVYTQTVTELLGIASPTAVDCAVARFVAENAHRIATPADFDRQLKTR